LKIQNFCSMTRKIVLISFLFLLFSCSSKDEILNVPKKLIQPDEMVTILVDFHLVEASISQAQDRHDDVNQLTNFRYSSILEKHKITRAKFDESIDFYSGHMKTMHIIYEKVVEELNKTQSRIISK